MEDFPREPQEENLEKTEGDLEDTKEEPKATKEQESVESKIDHWKMAEVMREFGFTDINEHPAIMADPSLKEMRDQDLMFGTTTDSNGETITTIWRDGYCWARKGSHPQLSEIEQRIGHTLRRGAYQPANLVFRHSNIE
jgi:hypothetical protein